MLPKAANVWFLEAYGASGTPETLVDSNRYEGFETFDLEPRVASEVLGDRPSGGILGDTGGPAFEHDGKKGRKERYPKKMKNLKQMQEEAERTPFLFVELSVSSCYSRGH